MYYEITEENSRASDQVGVVLGAGKSGSLIGPRTGHGTHATTDQIDLRSPPIPLASRLSLARLGPRCDRPPARRRCAIPGFPGEAAELTAYERKRPRIGPSSTGWPRPLPFPAGRQRGRPASCPHADCPRRYARNLRDQRLKIRK